MATAKAKPGRVWLRRLLWGAGAVAVLAFAIEGGEYGTRDLLAQRRDRAQLETELALLRDTVATLREALKLVRTDDATLERIAREEHGLVKSEKELIYRVQTAQEPVGVDSVPPR